MTRMTASAAIRAALRGFEPSAEQWDAITAPLEPISIVAGAGSGKTAVMTARIVHLVESAIVRPSQVLGLTFTNKAAGELEERLSDALGKVIPHPREHPHVTTYNAFAQEIVRAHGPRIGIDPDASLLTLAQKWQMLLGLVESLPSFEKLEMRHPLSFIPQTLELADQCANHLVTPTELRAASSDLEQQAVDDYTKWSAQKRRDLTYVLEAYEQTKRARRRIDYGDQISLAVEILQRFDAVAAEYMERYPIVLLDEYQDTNPAQKVMLQRIIAPGGAVTAVGDARQAIYGWRGASMFNLIGFCDDFPRADGSPCRMTSLSENYRSGRRIVSLANRVIAAVAPERRPGAELVAVPANGEGWVGAGVFGDQEAEAAYIADEIEKLHEGGLEWREVAILVRSRRYMDAIVRVLESRDIPVEIPDLGGLLKIPAVVDTVAWLRVLSDPGPSTNRWLARILMGPRFRIHYRDLAPIARWAVQHTRELTDQARELLAIEEPDPGEVAYSLFDALRSIDEIEGVSEEARERIGEFRALTEGLRPQASRPLLDLVQSVVERTGIADALAASVSRSAPAMAQNLRSFCGVASEFSPLDGEPTLGAFIDFLDAAEESEDPIPLAASSTSDSVKVMTVHGAKGLEFDTVFIPALAAQQKTSRYDPMRIGSVFPDVRASNPLSSTRQLPPAVRKDAPHLPVFTGNKAAYRKALRERAMEDERRLFYVAVTRARQRLYCTGAWWYGTDEESKGPSEFLDDVMKATDVVDLVEQAAEPAPGDPSPVIEQLRKDLVWPPDAPAYDDDTLAWLAKVDGLVDGTLGLDDVLTPEGAEAIFAEHQRTIDALRQDPGSGESTARPRSLPATTAIRLALGRERSDTVLHPLPQRPTEAQRLGIELHAWIEELSRGLIGLAEEEALDQPSLRPGPDTVARLRRSFEDMGYPQRELAILDSGEPMAELPFTLKIGDILVRGRIDAVYTDHPSLEIVDFKTGLVPEAPDWGQLELYAEALAELGVVNGPVKLTYAYLQTGEAHSTRYTPRGIGWITEALEKAVP